MFVAEILFSAGNKKKDHDKKLSFFKWEYGECIRTFFVFKIAPIYHNFYFYVILLL